MKYLIAIVTFILTFLALVPITGCCSSTQFRVERLRREYPDCRVDDDGETVICPVLKARDIIAE